MKRSTAKLRVLATLVLLIASYLPLAAHAQCPKPMRTSVATTAYDRPPTFSSSSGWQFGSVVATLPQNTEVRVCEEVTVGLFFEKKTWYRIEFSSGRTGWIFSGQVHVARAENPVRRINFELISTAAASDETVQSGTPGFSRWTMIFVALLFVVLGMIGKVTCDQMDSSPTSPLRGALDPRKFLRALIAAPIAILAFLKLADFSFSNEIAVVVFCCMAFQNGFFWQTLLPGGKATQA